MQSCRKRRLPCIVIGLSLFLVGCQLAEVGPVESDLVLSQQSDVSSQAVSPGLEDTPSETVTSQEESSSASTESSENVASEGDASAGDASSEPASVTVSPSSIVSAEPVSSSQSQTVSEINADMETFEVVYLTFKPEAIVDKEAMTQAEYFPELNPNYIDNISWVFDELQIVLRTSIMPEDEYPKIKEALRGRSDLLSIEYTYAEFSFGLGE